MKLKAIPSPLLLPMAMYCLQRLEKGANKSNISALHYHNHSKEPQVDQSSSITPRSPTTYDPKPRVSPTPVSNISASQGGSRNRKPSSFAISRALRPSIHPDDDDDDYGTINVGELPYHSSLPSSIAAVGSSEPNHHQSALESLLVFFPFPSLSVPLSFVPRYIKALSFPNPPPTPK